VLNFKHLLVGLVLQQQLHFIEVVSEVVLTVSLDIVLRILNVPIVSNSFSALVKLNEFLKFEVSASKSVLKPIDCNSLNGKSKQKQANYHQAL
jgi:hypothetical protein